MPRTMNGPGRRVMLADLVNFQERARWARRGHGSPVATATDATAARPIPEGIGRARVASTQKPKSPMLSASKT